MSPMLTCLAMALAGVDLGYQPYSNGTVEFIIQINPATLQALQPGERFNIDVPREARDLRTGHFSISRGTESLPHMLPAVAATPPATAPVGPASPIMPAMASAPTTTAGGPADSRPLNIAPPSASGLPPRESAGSSPYAVQRRSTVAHSGPLLNPSNPAALPAPARSGDSKIARLAPVNPEGGNSGQVDRPWLAMLLFVIALAASNIYVGWLFWDARQRYRGLLARTFSVGQQTAEA